MSTDLISALEACLLTREQSALDNPDELFYCSYLISHLNLAAAESPESEESFLHTVEQSLDSAFAVDRLNDQDKSGIRSLWNEVCGEISSPLAN